MALTTSDRLILIKISEAAGMMTLNEIATATGLSPLTTQRRCIGLCNNGFLQRHRIHRVTHYSVTEDAPSV